MASRHYKSGLNRNQPNLFPPSLDDYVSRINPVRAIDAYVETLDLNGCGFKYSAFATGSGHPPYDPGDLLKLYLYGYINHVRSSRKLERETYRNVEVMWLMGQLNPSYKTIADFRKNNADALKQVNRDFILLCRELNLYGGKTVAIDGSFFRGNASKASIFTKNKLKKQIAKLDSQIEDYQKELDANDRAETGEDVSRQDEDSQLAEKLEHLRHRQAQKQRQLEQLQEGDEKQLSTTDPDARLLSKSGQLVAGYNVQSVIDDKHHLLIHSEATNACTDLHQLYPMAAGAKADELKALADRGYYEGQQLKHCEDHGIHAYVPEPDRNKPIKAQGRYTREAFDYDAEKNRYICPQGQELPQLGKPHEKNGKMLIRYASRAADCKHCPVRNECLTEKSRIRQIHRWEHEGVLERHRERMRDSKKEIVQRAALVEHPFGTWKDRAGWTYHFLVRGLKKVRGEWSIMAVGYNFTRVLNILGVDAFMDYCAQRRMKIAS